jgi:hypothetical protein
MLAPMQCERNAHKGERSSDGHHQTRCRGRSAPWLPRLSQVVLDERSGLAKWAASPHPYTALKNHFRKYIAATYLGETVAQWFHDVSGIWPGERKGKNRVGKG